MGCKLCCKLWKLCKQHHWAAAWPFLPTFSLAVWIFYVFLFLRVLKLIALYYRFKPETCACMLPGPRHTHTRTTLEHWPHTPPCYALTNCRYKVVQLSEQSVKREQLCGLGEVSCSLRRVASSVLSLCCLYCAQQEASSLRGWIFAMGSKAAGLHFFSLWSSVAPLLHRLPHVQCVRS